VAGRIERECRSERGGLAVQRLTEDQRTRIEKLATEEGTTCDGCGRAGLRCGEEARRTHDHGLMIYLWCANKVHPRGAYQYFTIPAGENIGV
jgi:hypothetical protein